MLERGELKPLSPVDSSNIWVRRRRLESSTFQKQCNVARCGNSSACPYWPGSEPKKESMMKYSFEKQNFVTATDKIQRHQKRFWKFGFHTFCSWGVSHDNPLMPLLYLQTDVRFVHPTQEKKVWIRSKRLRQLVGNEPDAHHIITWHRFGGHETPHKSHWVWQKFFQKIG